jgi:hypothetical protein
MSSEAFRKISKNYRPSKMKGIRKNAKVASGNTLIPEGVCMFPMEWKNKYATRPSLQKPGTTNNPGYRWHP